MRPTKFDPMNTIRLLSLALFLSATSFAQRFTEVVKWEAETVSNGIVFGIAPSKSAALKTLKDFHRRNLDSRYELKNIHEARYLYATLRMETKNDDVFYTFQKINNKSYRVFSNEDLVALKIWRNSSIDAAASYYSKRRLTTIEFATKHLQSLLIYQKYRILINDNNSSNSMAVVSENMKFNSN